MDPDSYTYTDSTIPTDGSPSFVYSDIHSPNVSEISQTGKHRPSLMASLISLWKSERVCADILPYDNETIEAVITEINEREAAAKDRPDPETTLTFNPFDIILYELSRAKYFLADYLRIRLEKISACSHTLLRDEKMMKRLSAQEREWAKRYAHIEHECMLRNGLANVPLELRHLTPNPPFAEGREIEVNPPKHHFVFIRVIDTIGSFDIGGGVIQELVRGDIYVLKYEVIEGLLLSGKVQLM